MKKPATPFQTGGGGTNFEQSVQTAFLTTMIIRGNAPCLPVNEISKVQFQTTNLGYKTDDLLVRAKSANHEHRLLAQIKHKLTFSEKNDIFKEVITAFWQDFNSQEIFDPGLDRLIIITSGFAVEQKGHLKTLFNWARSHESETDFLLEVGPNKSKLERLDIFRAVLNEANGREEVSDSELWRFLRCLDILEYDFMNEGSVDMSHFLNLIKLSKNDTTTLNEGEIWNSILAFASKLNKDGGDVSIESVQKEPIYTYFDPRRLSPSYQSIRKLESDSEAILGPLKSDINGFHLNRVELEEKVAASINSHRLTVVTGKPGVGKSAIVKNVLAKKFPNAHRIVFRADQFNMPHLANTLAAQGVNEPLTDLLSCIALFPEKIIVIDSLEKLLEGDPENAFKQLLHLLKQYPDIRVVGSGRKYAIDMIQLKYGIDQQFMNMVEIDTLSDQELEAVSVQFPSLKALMSNQKLKELFEIPKYLDFTIAALQKGEEDLSAMSVAAFKDKLWNSLVKDVANRKQGISAKREDAFLKVATSRARQMKLFVKPEGVDEEALELLEADEIIFQDCYNRRYSPTHDILEDWALVRHVTSVYEDHKDPKDLFAQLGTEPAIRRAFRLWVEDMLMDDPQQIINLVSKTLDDKSIEPYWADELLVAIFKSDDCSPFFEAFEKALLDQNATLLERCIHLVRTACRERHLRNQDSTILLPVGSGWPHVIAFIRKHVEQVDNLRPLILRLLSDWEYRIIFQQRVPESEYLDVKQITMFYISQVETENEFWKELSPEGRSSLLVDLLFRIAHLAQDEIKQLFERAFQAKEDQRNWRMRSFYKLVLEKTLSGLSAAQSVCKELPDLIIDTAWREWKLHVPERDPADVSISSQIIRSRISDEECWGIQNKPAFFPSGIYKTPFYHLLFFHPLKALSFIVEFLNYSVDFYVQADCGYKRELSQVQLVLNDGTKVEQWGSEYLWKAYRGTSVTHYANESLLMSLEMWMLEMAKIGTEGSRNTLNFAFNDILSKSNNVAPTSVLASVAMAYPKEVGEAMLPLFTAKEIFNWDIKRAIDEHGALSPLDREISFAQEERAKSNRLEHRTKYQRGLAGFLVDYQCTISTMNLKIQLIIDRLKAEANVDDPYWKKLLMEMDIRNWEVKNTTLGEDNTTRAEIGPTYDEEITALVESNKEEFEAQSTSMNYSALIKKAYDAEEPIDYAGWQKCFDQYFDHESLNLLLDRPVTTAFVGLQDFAGELTDEEKGWCIETLAKSITAILHDTFRQRIKVLGTYNLMEKEIALSSFHLLLEHSLEDEKKNNVLLLLLNTLTAPFAGYEVDQIIQYVRTRVFKRFPNETKRVWRGLAAYAYFKKRPHYHAMCNNPDKREALASEEATLLERLASTDEYALEIETINFDEYEGWIIGRMLTITPFETEDQEYAQFIQQAIHLVIADQSLKDEYDFPQANRSEQIRHNGVSDICDYLAELLLGADNVLSHEVVDQLYDSLSDQLINHRPDRGLPQFVYEVLETASLKLYDLGYQQAGTSECQKPAKNFWGVWRHLGTRIQGSERAHLLSALFLDFRFLYQDGLGKVRDRPFKAFEHDEGYYAEMVKTFSQHRIAAYIVQTTATIGHVYIPDALNWTVSILKGDQSQIPVLTTSWGELFAKVLFQNHLTQIKGDRSLVNNYLWILDQMVDQGSSQAYFFRENVITYKSHVA